MEGAAKKLNSRRGTRLNEDLPMSPALLQA